MRTAAVALLLLLLAACGAESDGSSAAPSPSTGATTQPAVGSAVVDAAGPSVPEALLRFRCEKNAEGRWAASGFLVNGGKALASFQVTVFIGEATGSPERAKTKRVENIAPDGSVAFKIYRIPAPEGGGTCHVQVLQTK
ncbi:hypothetical protein GEV29_05040 [Aeromicrobium sp. SMF47]|uniref:Uncharacterized protein n=1 Tax=Aeromicrobium yanjiei TaxID=2662028 RepID=A0A5Q2MIB2_9ACTN|nr:MULTISPECIES: hypothetical protein [Aeromicrobium]MRJ75892.1 hypothetical protein [Aeromicrobium yanjiei]MRK00237.1 hypothetical protein [Aeromicrobium sp. S22]QGG42867.1 hypothetical protein GEV26_16620 [Aeromicrobium yanjiei]